VVGEACQDDFCIKINLFRQAAFRFPLSYSLCVASRSSSHSWLHASALHR
jgi:hypothetical protein